MYDGDKVEKAHIPGARLAHARRAPTRARPYGVGTRNRPQSLILASLRLGKSIIPQKRSKTMASGPGLTAALPLSWSYRALNERTWT